MLAFLLRTARERAGLTFAFWLGLVAVCAWLASGLVADNRLEVFRAPHHPVEQGHEAATQVFGEEDRLLIALHAAEDGQLGTHGGLTKLYAFRERLLAASPHSTLVDVFELEPDYVRAAQRDAPDDEPLPDNGVPAVGDATLYTDDHAVAILIRRSDGGSGAMVRSALCDAVRDAAEPLVSAGWELHLAGEPENHYWLSLTNEQTQARAVPILFLAIAAMLFALFRQPPWLLVIGATIVPAPLAAMATLALLGGTLNSVTTVLPILVSTIALATALHVLIPMGRRLSGVDAAHRDDLIAEIARDRWTPACLAHFTTAIAFGSLYFSDVGTITDLGISAAVALVVSLLSSFHLLPALVGKVAPANISMTAAHEGVGFTDELAKVLVRVPRVPTFVVAVGVILWGTYAVSLIPVESDGRKFFPDTHPLPSGSEELASLGFPSGSVEIVFPDVTTLHSDRANGWARLEPALDALETTGFVTISPRTLVAAARERTPLAAMLPVDAVIAGVRAISEDIVNLCFAEDGTGVRVLVLAPMGGLEVWAAQRAAIESALDELDDDVHEDVILTGLYPRAIAIQDGLIGTLRSSLLLTGACIAVLLLCFRPRRFVWLIVLIPNLAPLALQAGLQIVTGMPHDIGTILVYGITLGLVVDGTFHILHDLEWTGSSDRAVVVARMLRNSGRALLFAALVLAAGFATLSVSEFKPNARFGMLLGFGVLAGALCNLGLLPVLLGKGRAGR